jgi:anti-sigma regulatory factor (Ser/Thr protein kinase)
MHTMVPGRVTDLHACRVRLPRGPAAAAAARRQVRAAIYTWNASVDEDVAILLTSELVTNAIKHAAGGAVTLSVRCTRTYLRVDVLDMSSSPPRLADVTAEDEAGRGLMLVDSLSAYWGSYRTPTGKAVYFTLALQDPDHGADGEMTDPRIPDARTDLNAEQAREDTDNPRGPCKRCGALSGTHFLTCPLLRLPDQPEPPP